MTLPLIHDLLARAAAEHGERVAVVDRERSLSYAELERRANQLSRLLLEHGVKAGDRVALFLEKSLEAVIGIYATLKAGGVYVPLDEQAPPRRLAYIARDAGVRVAISSPKRAGECSRLREYGAAIETIFGAPEVPWSVVDSYDDTPPAVDVGRDSLAYILYTSGSTGDPKGVMLSHENGMAFVDWAAREVGVRADDRLSSHAPFHFDLSTFDLYAAAWAGASVTLVPRETSMFPVEMSRFIREAGITVWYSVPSALTQLVLHGQLEQTTLPDLRAVIFAGEVFPTKYLVRLIELVPQPRYFNFFGPTETNVCTWYEVPRDRPLPDPLPIGSPLPVVEAIVEGDGELLIRGPTVMHGYWGDRQRTGQVLEVRDGQRTYRTGDLVRRGRDGELVFLGRRDAQVKTRGFRVELEEIEAALLALEGVVEAAVIAVPDEAITNRLKAYVVTDGALDARELGRLCRERLPAYMIPEQFELRQELPKSSTGKVDRRALQGQQDRG